MSWPNAYFLILVVTCISLVLSFSFIHGLSKPPFIPQPATLQYESSNILLTSTYYHIGYTQVLLSLVKIARQSKVVYCVFKDLQELVGQRRTWTDAISHLFGMLGTDVSREDPLWLAGPFALGTVEGRGEKREGIGDRSSCFLCGRCWQWCVPKMDFYISYNK